jgi:hypothetical protein
LLDKSGFDSAKSEFKSQDRPIAWQRAR